MIKSFNCHETELIYSGEYSKKLPRDIQRRAWQKLLLIAAATSLEDLRSPPSNYLEKLTGDRKEQHSIRINKQ
ncbi:MAG: plasmid maintenance system killer protein [Gammaproteobacteria bacterium]|jgi:proteic killer suppression protein|nr:plasmid maintenance system killer protein [Gammaproteobacteria bacterium]